VTTNELISLKKKMRAERFGIVTKESEEAKKLERIKRFGIPTDTDLA